MKVLSTIIMPILLLSGSLQAAFMIEAYSDGLASDHFAFTGDGTAVSWSSTPSSAYGVTASKSAFGGNGATYDEYTYSYTPGVDIDNIAIAVGTDLGNGNLASGLPGGGSGKYNVYITWPASTGVSSLSTITVTNDGAPVVLTSVDMNTGGTGTPGGNNGWLKIASEIPLTAGLTYTIVQRADSPTYVSQRSHGVLFEAVPEPATISLFTLGGLGLLRRRRS